MVSDNEILLLTKIDHILIVNVQILTGHFALNNTYLVLTSINQLNNEKTEYHFVIINNGSIC